MLCALDFLLPALLREVQEVLLLKFLSAVRMKSSAKPGIAGVPLLLVPNFLSVFTRDSAFDLSMLLHCC